MQRDADECTDGGRRVQPAARAGQDGRHPGARAHHGNLLSSLLCSSLELSDTKVYEP